METFIKYMTLDHLFDHCSKTNCKYCVVQMKLKRTACPIKYLWNIYNRIKYLKISTKPGETRAEKIGELLNKSLEDCTKENGPCEICPYQLDVRITGHRKHFTICPHSFDAILSEEESFEFYMMGLNYIDRRLNDKYE